MRGCCLEGAGWAHRDFDQLQIPFLTEDTAELLPNQCLVRYRGLVSPHGRLRLVDLLLIYN
jgi:hypothetical protein